MVQEFHVLRCFTCRTFQVQQVKKSKKWSCKLCGEKQSLIKEYGRGTGADCRRHVQKLNSLRGELLEVETERAWTRWEEEECEVEVDPGDETQNLEQKTRVISRWSKYVDQGENGPERDEDEHQEEEENVYTDTEQCRQRNIRKRKKSFTSGDARGHSTAGGDEDADAARRGALRLPSQPRRHDDTFKPPALVSHSSAGFPRTSTSLRTDALCCSPAALLGSKHISAYNGSQSSSGADKQSSAELSSTSLKPSVPVSSFFATSSFQKHPTESKPQAKDSKWARFLPSVCVEDDKDEVPLQNGGSCTSSGGSEGALVDNMFSVEKCMAATVCKLPSSPDITSRPIGSQKPLPPAKRPCPSLSFNTLFHTNEDFDDTY
ncbi:hypothetical protein AMELA_G00097160 [Ameiurus melas]|uniref:MRN complex-interacting protein N-terminal domain-containing protein n=1 Tax=Ameiurus melas TaxID=219545 RepID=A0A7J6AUI3_AMEME|nr:hypothetical protein AMELA_G00097160 [Ameiurus melas]